MKIDLKSLTSLREAAQTRLFSAFREEGIFEGCLSNSALAVALSSLALARGGRPVSSQRGRLWLMQHQNPDGGWGDTPDSPSNLATTLLTLCALREDVDALNNTTSPVSTTSVQQAKAWLITRIGGLEPHQITQAVAAFYGSDRTFSAPILSICAMCGLLGPEPAAWRFVMPLPFEVACLPHQIYKWLRLPVVSYALPALIAIGLARHRKCPTNMLPWRWLRNACARPALRILQRIQPESGGFLEATPLTAFVALNLMAAGEKDSPVLASCLAFLEHGQGADGGWPIDTNLATWTTTLAVAALADAEFKSDGEAWRAKTRTYLLRVQQHGIHPFTNAAPGGWAWTYLSGGVPDADDTAAALLALNALRRDGGAAYDMEVCNAARAGIEWLLSLQNRDGGMPTFCRGWLNLPFDRSCPDITAHVLAAFAVWTPDLPELKVRLDRAKRRAVSYLARTQRADGAWIPLWFGNQAAPRHENPVYGTARVIEGLTRLPAHADVAPLIATGTAWLVSAQNPDGGWGGALDVPSSIEETALAVTALAQHADESVLANALRFLEERTQHGTCFPTTPIGLYFSSLWYSETLYPVIFTTHALKALSKRLEIKTEIID